MKYGVFSAFVFALLFCACTGQGAASSKSAAETATSAGAAAQTTPGPVQPKSLPPGPTPPVFVNGLNTAPALDAWMNTGLAAEGNYTNKIQTIQRGAETHQVMIFSDPAGKVRMVRADLSGGKKPSTLEFFLNQDKVVVLREFLPGEPPVENRFYNRQDGQLMDCKSRTITNGMVADSVKFKPYISKYGFDDFRLKPSYVQKWVDDYLIGK